MATLTSAPYGLWRSPFTPKLLAQEKRLSDIHWDTDAETLVWLEGRSDRSVLMAVKPFGDGDAARELTTDLSVRAKVGYGGGDFIVSKGRVVFAEGQSGRLYLQSLSGGAARPITPDFGLYAAPRATPDGRFITFIHHDVERIDRLGIVDTQGQQWPQVLHQGHDFYAYNRISPDGKYMAFVAWDHPNMPWDGTYLYVAPLLDAVDDGSLPRLGPAQKVAGAIDTAIAQPEFSPDSQTLYFISDESGIGNLHALDLATRRTCAVTTQRAADLGRPAWTQDTRTFGLLPDSKTAVVWLNEQGFVRMARVDLSNGSVTPLVGLAPYTDVSSVTVHPQTGRLAIIGSAAAFGARVTAYDLGEDRAVVVARASSESFEARDLSTPEALSWPTGPGGREACYGLYYPPCNPHFSSSGKPPLVVIVHGGPTSQVRAAWSTQAQFFATRGYGVLYVNHRGSTGYGRDYMLKQRGAWGLVDVEDSISGARYLAAQGRVDGARTIIMGGSAGGYTVLQAMVDDPDAFAAGICLYGIANQFSCLSNTHKFEERYSDRLLGTLPEAAELYRQRSPVLHAHKIKRPIAVFQGDRDNVVPPEQSDIIVKALQRNGTPHIYQIYQGEGHGWRKAETIEHFYETVDKFLKEYIVYA